MDALRGADGEALDATLDGLERCIALARVAVEHGQGKAAAEHILGGLADLKPELKALHRLAEPAPPVPAAVGSTSPCLLAIVLPLALFTVSLAIPAVRVAPLAPHIAVTALVAWVCGFRPALLSLTISLVCGGSMLALTSLEPFELPLRLVLSTAASVVVAYTASHHRTTAPRQRPAPV